MADALRSQQPGQLTRSLVVLEEAEESPASGEGPDTV